MTHQAKAFLLPNAIFRESVTSNRLGGSRCALLSRLRARGGAEMSALRFLLLILILLNPYALFAQTGPPVIQSQPQSTNVFAGGTVVFRVVATGATPLSYQWFKTSTTSPPLSKETNATLTLVGVDLPDGGSGVRGGCRATDDGSVSAGPVPLHRPNGMKPAGCGAAGAPC